MTLHSSRRSFLQGSFAAGAALVVGLTPEGVFAAGNAAAELNPFVKISADGTVTVVVKHFEMGQGTTTGLPTLVAEELDADWQRVEIAFAPADNSRYANLAFGSQGTGGSTAMANSYLQYRSAGAAAREVLVKAAAESWGVDVAEVTIENGILRAGGHAAHFGEMAAPASAITPSEKPALKNPRDFRLIGTANLARKDSRDKTDGTAKFAMDVKLPGMVTALILRPPRFGASLVSFDAAGAKDVNGFVDAKALPNAAGVAVFAKSTWAAIQARQAITAEWDFAKAENRSSEQLIEDHLALLAEPQYAVGKQTDRAATDAAIGKAVKTVEADFVFPYLAHAPMEPLNCVIEPTATGVRLHDGCQFPGFSQPTIAGVLGLAPDKVEINTVLAGGSFGRRATPNADYQVEAAMAFAALGGKTPVKLVWTREDDLQGGYYRAMAAHRVRIGLGEDGAIAGWDHRIATKSIMKGGPFEAFTVHDGVDHTSVEGVPDTAYAIPGLSVGLSDFETPVPVLWWRSVGNTHTAYAMEVMLDMAAAAAGIDPVAFRLDLLKGASKDQQRLAGVLKLAAEKAGWGEPLAAGRGRGIAVHKSFNSYVAEVVEVSTAADVVKIERVTCAVDCGIAVNPDVIKAQMEGGIGYGLGAVMRNAITLADGEVQESNFPDYEPLRMPDIGRIDVHILASDEAPTGVGEPGTPPSGPALANAIFAATGKRITRLPMAANGVDFA